MKGLNTARIMGLAGLTMALTASVVAAGTVYSSELKDDPIITANGQPAAKIVVGASAGISDGIAASNIAAALAQYTYESKKVTTMVTGLEGVSCTSGASTGTTGAGACEISNKKVSIDITVPGTLANAHQFKTLITDTIDKQLGNRMNTLSEDNYTATLTSSDTSNILSPLRAAYGDSQTSRNLYRIGESQFSPFATDKNTPVRDDQASSEFTYTAEQGFWVGSAANAVAYDSNSLYRSVIAKPNIVAYNVRFLGNDYGIPVCTKTNETGKWAGCASTSTDSTQRHRVAIPFLGQKWVISEMTAPSNVSAPLGNTNGAVNGGKVKLAKEADYRIVSIGEQIDAGTFKVRLSDISVAVGSDNTHPAILDVLDSNNQVVGQIQVTPGETYTYTQSGTGNSIKVHVYQTAGGLTLSAKWAEIAIFTDEITLEDGKRYNQASSDDVNWKNIYASLLWKTRDGSSTNNQANSLREIVLYVDDMQNYMGGENRMKASDSIVFPKKDSIYRLTYNGLDLGSGDYVSMSVRSDSGRTIMVGNTGDCNTKNNSYTGSFLKVSSDKDNAFGGSSANAFGTDDRVSDFYVDPVGGFVVNGTDQTQVTTKATWAPQIYWKPSGCSYYKVATLTGAAGAANAGKAVINLTTSNVKFDTAGDDSSAPGLLAFYFVANSSTYLSATNAYGSGFVPSASLPVIGEVVMQEDAGKLNTVSHHHVMVRMPVYNISGNDWQFKGQSSSTAYTYYNAIDTSVTGSTVVSLAGSYELPLYTERGSKVTDVSLTGTTLSVANKIGQPMFTFTAASTTASEANTETWVAQEGDSKTLSNGVVLKVKSIDQTVGSCSASVTAGGAPACTVTGTNGVSATADPAQALSRYTGALSMVVKDSDADAKTSGAVRISVGGPLVNSLTSDAMKTSELDASYFDKENTLVRAFGKTIVVAGKSSSDTLAAADAFIAKLSAQ